jgi:ketosteroid isomerase-like protein
MSEENVELVRRWIDACNDGRLEDAVTLVARDFEMTEAQALPGAHSLRGHEALRSYFAGWARQWSEWDWKIEEITDVPPDRVLLDARLALRGLRSTAWVERRWAYVFTIRDGLLAGQDGFDDRAKALEAMGLTG